MRTIQINYDLHAPGRNYQPLYDYIKSFGIWAHPLASMWLVRTNKSVTTVRDELNNLVDGNDEVLVLDVTGDNWASTFKDDHTHWMHGHMGHAYAA